MKNAVIFDLDGTLWDSTIQVITAWNKVLRTREDVDFVLSADDMKKLMGKTIDEIADIIFADMSHAQAMEIIDRCLAEEVRYLGEDCGTLYEGLEETLQALSAQYELALVSNCQIEYLETFFAATSLGKYFCDFECAGRTGLPKGENIQLVSKRNHFPAVIYVGDTQGDYNAAKIAGARFIHASYGFGEVKGDAYDTITSIKELPETVHKKMPPA